MGVKQKDFTVSQGFEGRDLPTKESFVNDDETVIFNVRLHKKRKEALQRAFKAKGMDLSTGLRMLAYEWLGRNIK